MNTFRDAWGACFIPMNVSYSEKLKDPRWQRRRLDVMDRDGFRCVHCGNEKETLNVHHLFYQTGLAPWEYPDRALITLCETHHKEEERNKTSSDWELVAAFRALGADNRALGRLSLMLREIAALGDMPGGALTLIEHAIDEIWAEQTKKERL